MRSSGCEHIRARFVFMLGVRTIRTVLSGWSHVRTVGPYSDELRLCRVLRDIERIGWRLWQMWNLAVIDGFGSSSLAVGRHLFQVMVE